MCFLTHTSHLLCGSRSALHTVFWAGQMHWYTRDLLKGRNFKFSTLDIRWAKCAVVLFRAASGKVLSILSCHWSYLIYQSRPSTATMIIPGNTSVVILFIRQFILTLFLATADLGLCTYFTVQVIFWIQLGYAYQGSPLPPFKYQLLVIATLQQIWDTPVICHSKWSWQGRIVVSQIILYIVLWTKVDSLTGAIIL